MTQQQEAEEQQGISIRELWEEIVDMAGVTPTEHVAMGRRCLWFPTPQSGKAPTLFEVNATDGENKPAEIPIKSGYIAFALFHDEDETRVYALPLAGQSAEGKMNPPLRLVLSKHAPVADEEIMSLDLFKDEIAAELKNDLRYDPEEILRDKFERVLQKKLNFSEAQVDEFFELLDKETLEDGPEPEPASNGSTPEGVTTPQS
jgi:hypothetical protein